MNNSLASHLTIKTENESKLRSTVVTKIGARPANHSDFRTECLLAAKKISAAANGQPVALLLDESFESAVTFLAFLKSETAFVTYLIDFTNLSASKKSSRRQVQDWITSFGVTVKKIQLDLNNPEHLEGLEKLQQKTDCAEAELFKIWAACNIDELTVLPGSFVTPVFDLSHKLKKWNLPSFKQLSLFNFFNEFGGVPFFFSSSPEMVYAQVESPVSLQMLALTENEGRILDPDSTGLKKKFAEQAFADELKNLIISIPVKSLRANDLQNTTVATKQRYQQLLEKMKVTNTPEEIQNVEHPHSAVQNVIKSKSYYPDVLALSEKDDPQGNIHLITGSGTKDHLTFGAFSTLITARHFKGDLKKVMDYIKTLDFYKSGPNTSSAGDLHEHTPLAELIEFFEESAELYFDEMGYVYDSCRITECWANQSEVGQQYNYHYHPNSFLSGVFYLTTGGGGNTVFRSPQKPQIVPHFEKITGWNTSTFQVSPEAGKLLLFPSHIDHQTTPHEDPNHLRCSIAFNVMLTGWLG